MVLKNNSSKIIGIGETSFLPGESAECPEGYTKNPVVQKYIKAGVFSEVKSEKKGSGTKKANDADKDADLVKDGNPDPASGSDGTGNQAGAK